MALTFWQRLRLRLGGAVYLEHRTKPEWAKPFPFYAFRCPQHGIVESRPYGWEERLDCPLCWKERWGEATHPDLVEQVVEEVLHG